MSPADTLPYVLGVWFAVLFFIERYFLAKTRKLLDDTLVEWRKSSKLIEELSAEANGYVRELAKVTDERDAALRDKAAQFEESQKQMELLRRECCDSIDLGVRLTREADRLHAENVRLCRIVDAARALSEYPPAPGEWKALRDALAEYDGKDGAK